MMRRFIERLTCDRCGHTVEMPQNIADPQRATFTTLKLEREERERDICNDCKQQFNEWWGGN